MLTPPVRRLLYIGTSGFFLFLLDRFFKWQALGSWSGENLPSRLVGWQPFFNSGAAFSLPVPMLLTIVLSAAMILAVLFELYSLWRQAKPGIAGLGLVLIGAVSNLIDRLAYHHTIDYLRFITGVFNLADFLIVAGLIIWYRATRRVV